MVDSCGALLCDIHSCRILLSNALAGHYCGRLLRDTLVVDSKTQPTSPKLAFRARLAPKVTREGCEASISYQRDFFQTSLVKSLKRAFRTSLPQKLTLRAFRTRHPPKFNRPVCKTSVSYETSSKSHMSKSPKRAFRTRLPPTVKRGEPHRSTLPATKMAVLAESRKHSFGAQQLEKQISKSQRRSHIQHPQNTAIQDNCASHKTLFLLRFHTFPRYFTRMWSVMLSSKPSPNASPNVSGGNALLRTVANGCERYDNESRTRLPPDPPQLNSSLRAREKTPCTDLYEPSV